MPAYSDSKYQSDVLNVHPIRLQPDTLLAAGSPPAGDINVPISADMRKPERRYGLGPRGVRASRIFGTAPDTFKRYIFVPVLTKASWGTGQFQKGGEITYKGAAWSVESVVPEYSK